MAPSSPRARLATSSRPDASGDRPRLESVMAGGTMGAGARGWGAAAHAPLADRGPWPRWAGGGGAAWDGVERYQLGLSAL